MTEPTKSTKPGADPALRFLLKHAAVAAAVVIAAVAIAGVALWLQQANRPALPQMQSPVR